MRGRSHRRSRQAAGCIVIDTFTINDYDRDKDVFSVFCKAYRTYLKEVRRGKPKRGSAKQVRKTGSGVSLKEVRQSNTVRRAATYADRWAGAISGKHKEIQNRGNVQDISGGTL